MKILHLRSSGAFLGAERVIMELCTKGREMGYEVAIGLVHNTSDPTPECLARASRAKIKTHMISGSGQFDLKRSRQIATIVKESGTHVVHSHGYKEDLHSVAARMPARRVSTNHLWKKSNLLGRLYAFADVVALHQMDFVVGVSRQILREMACFGIKNACLVRNGIDTFSFKNIQRDRNVSIAYGIAKGNYVIGMLSSLTPEKGHEVALRAFRLLTRTYSNVSLLIAGDGRCRESILRQVNDYGLQNRVHLVGREENVARFFSAIDVFLLSSYREGLPMALLEALSAGTPVIATDVGEISDVVENGKTGLVVKDVEAGQLHAAMQWVIENKESSARIGEQGREHVNKHFSSARMAAEYHRIYSSLL